MLSTPPASSHDQFVAGRADQPLTVPLHLARSLPRTLQFAVAEGGAVALDALRVVRRGDVGAEAQIDVPAGQRIELHVKNMDAQASEFGSETMHREKVVPAGQEVVVYVGPLRAGSYEFFDDFNPKARGHIVAK